MDAADAIFAVLSDPTRHHDTEPTDSVTFNQAEPITATGQFFHEHAL